MEKLTYIQENARLLFHSFFKDLFFFFLMRTTFKVFTEFVTISLLFYVLVSLAPRPVGSQIADQGSNLNPLHGTVMS